MEKYKKTIGFWGENIAKNFLRRHKYKIIEANKKIGYLEIDLIAKENKTWVFVEVKTRTSDDLGKAEDSLTAAQIKNLKRAINIYCGQKRIYQENIRLDLIAINCDRKNKTAQIKHYKEIF